MTLAIIHLTSYSHFNLKVMSTNSTMSETAIKDKSSHKKTTRTTIEFTLKA